MSEWDEVLRELPDESLHTLPGSEEGGTVPANFRTAMIAVRAEIRAARKAKEPHDAKLRQLYRIAAIDEWLFRGRNMNAALRIPRAALNRLDFAFEDFGYKKIDGLKVTDVKWLVAAFGEPERHRRPRAEYAAVWAVANEIEARAEAERSRPLEEQIPEFADAIRAGQVAAARLHEEHYERARHDVKWRQKMMDEGFPVPPLESRSRGCVVAVLAVGLISLAACGI